MANLTFLPFIVNVLTQEQKGELQGQEGNINKNT
jgi:hypothetical protein